MQKQGPPEPLSKTFLNKKRKGQSDSLEPAAKKKKQFNGGAKSQTVKTVAVPQKGVLKQTRKEAVVQPVNGTKKPRATAKPTSEEALDLDENDGAEDDESSMGSEDGIDDPDIMEDTFNAEDVDRAADIELQDDSGSDPFDSQDEGPRDGAMWSDEDEGTDVDLDAANLEGLSNHLDAKAAQEAAQAQAELEEAALQTNIADDTIPDLDSEDENAHLKPRLAPDLQMLRQRMTDTIRILTDFSKHKTATKDLRSRSEYTAQLLKDICAYYSYSPFLADKLFRLFTPSEAFAFFEANETPRPVVLRTNSLKTHRRALAQALINRGVVLEPVGKWSKVGLQVFESTVPLGATPEYLAGHYILQAASSFLPVMALAPQEHERVLDMAAAPGGKTTHMAALMHNTGMIFANDPNKARAKALIGNIARLGAKNAIISSCDALEFPKLMWGGLDRVLLDAPCSGTGVIAKDPSVKTGKTEQDFIRLPELQKKLLLAAIDSVDHSSKTGGYLVYSTCSVTVEENESVVAYALSRRPNVKIVETGLSFGREGFVSYERRRFPDAMKMARRYYPHSYNVDGFFVCKLKKIGPTVRGSSGATGPVTGNMAAPSKSEEDQPHKPQPEETAQSETAGPEGTESEPTANGEDEFGGFLEEEEADKALMERARRRAMRRKGLNPRADRRKAQAKGDGRVNGSAKTKAA